MNIPTFPVTRISAVAFDLDGTTLNSEDLYLEVCTELMRRRGHEYDIETRMKMMGLPAPQAYEVLIHSKALSDSWEDLQAESDIIFESLMPKRLLPMEGVVALLDFLDTNRIPRCIATSSRESFARKALKIVGLLERFDFIITAEHVAAGKPHPDIYLAAADRMKTLPGEMLVLEDSSIGVAAGVAANCFVVAVPNSHTEGCNFSGSRLVLNSLSDPQLLSLLEHSLLKSG